MSPAWERFLDEFFRRPGERPDLRVLDALDPYEREHAIDLLIEAATRGDAGAIDGLAQLRAERAIGPLQSLMRGRDAALRVSAAAALWWLFQDPDALATLSHELSTRPLLRSAPHRVHAAAVLSRIDNDTARRALARAIHDAEYQVRYHAYEGLAGVIGRTRENWNYVNKPEIHHHVRARIDAKLRRAGLA